MKAKQKMQLPLGNWVVAAYQVWGPGLAAKMLRWAIKTRFVEFNGHPRNLSSSLKGDST
jgi:hypothetical protein